MLINFLSTQDKQEQFLWHYRQYILALLAVLFVGMLTVVVYTLQCWRIYEAHAQEYAQFTSTPAVVQATKERIDIEKKKRALLTHDASYHVLRRALWHILDVTTRLNNQSSIIQLDMLHMNEKQWTITGQCKDVNVYEQWKNRLQGVLPTMEVQGEQRSHEGVVAFTMVCTRKGKPL